MPTSGWISSDCMHTPTTRMRASLGAMRMACPIIPGTPTASKITNGLDRSPPSRHASIAGVSRGSTTTSAPIRSASARRRGGEVGGDDRADAQAAQLGDARQADRSAAEHDRAVTDGDAALGHGVHADGERLGERGEVGGQVAGHLERQQLVHHQQIGVAAVVPVRVADRVHAVGVERHRHADHDVAGAQVGSRLRRRRPPRSRTRGPSPCRGRARTGSARRDRRERCRGAAGRWPRISAPWRTMCRSLPQIPQARTLVSTWPGPGVGSGRSSTRSCQSRMIVARMAATLGRAARTWSAGVRADRLPTITANAASASRPVCSRAVRRRAPRAGCAGRSTVWPRVSSPWVSTVTCAGRRANSCGWVSAITAQRIVHGRAAHVAVAVDVGAAEEVEEVGEDRRHPPGQGAHERDPLRRRLEPVGEIESAHDQRAAVAEDDGGGVGVRPDVELGHRRAVAERATAHQRDARRAVRRGRARCAGRARCWSAAPSARARSPRWPGRCR